MFSFPSAAPPSLRASKFLISHEHPSEKQSRGVFVEAPLTISDNLRPKLGVAWAGKSMTYSGPFFPSKPASDLLIREILVPVRKASAVHEDMEGEHTNTHEGEGSAEAEGEM